MKTLFPRARGQIGRVTLPAALLAVGLALGAYSTLKYGPVYGDFQRIKALVGEAGQRAVTDGRLDPARSWFDERTTAEGFSWLESNALFWERIDREHVDVGVRYMVRVDHLLLGGHNLELSYYCTATLSGCAPFVPRW